MFGGGGVRANELNGAETINLDGLQGTVFSLIPTVDEDDGHEGVHVGIWVQLEPDQEVEVVE
jgi:hypothetical protein